MSLRIAGGKVQESEPCTPTPPELSMISRGYLTLTIFEFQMKLNKLQVVEFDVGPDLLDNFGAGGLLDAEEASQGWRSEIVGLGSEVVRREGHRI
ncbi:hypothetical protein ACFX1T_038353 [Malus domestica]